MRQMRYEHVVLLELYNERVFHVNMMNLMSKLCSAYGHFLNSGAQLKPRIIAVNAFLSYTFIPLLSYS